MRVLIVEDEPYLAEAIRDGLRLEAIAADIAGDGDTALELLSINAYDIAVLDRDIPGPSGDEIAERIVASGSGMPILMLTAADRLDDKASGFELGADDYLTKPFELRELVLRLRALDRRRAHHRPPVREIAGLRLDPFRREVYRDGRYVALTRKQFAVLEVLVAAEGGVVSAEELLERAWDENADPFTNAVRITVSALRKRLGEPWLIATVPGVGYRIDAARRRARRATVDRAPGHERPPQAHPQLRRVPHGRRRPAARGRVGVPAALRARRTRSASSPRAGRFGPSSRRSDLWRAFVPGGLGAGVPAGVRSRGRVDPRRPDARPADPHHRCHPRGRRRVALPPDPAARAAATSSASSPTPSTRMLARLEAHVAEQQRFAANASHELRTPLAITQTLLDVARKDPDRDTGELVDRLHVVNTRAIDLTEALLLLSRADQRSFTREHVDLSLVAEEATETLLPLAEQRGVTIETSGDVAPTIGSHRAPAAADDEPRAQRDRPQPARAAAPCGSRTSAQPDERGCSPSRTPASRSPRSSSPRSPSRSSAAPNASAPTTQVSASAWPSSRASPRPTTGPSPSRPGPRGGLRVTVRLPARTCWMSVEA